MSERKTNDRANRNDRHRLKAVNLETLFDDMEQILHLVTFVNVFAEDIQDKATLSIGRLSAVKEPIQRIVKALEEAALSESIEKAKENNFSEAFSTDPLPEAMTKNMRK